MLDIISWKEYKTVLFKRDYVVNLEIAAWDNITIETNNSNKSQVCASSCLRIDGMNYLFVVSKIAISKYAEVRWRMSSHHA